MGQFKYFNRQKKWDQRFLNHTCEVASWSKDPSTKVGAVIVDNDLSIISEGFNGFARRVKDLPERYSNRDLKYTMIVHAEINAIIFARRDLRGCTLYTWPFMPCSSCAAIIINTGISRCVAPPVPDHLRDRWQENMEIARMQFEEAGVVLDIVDVGSVNETKEE